MPGIFYALGSQKSKKSINSQIIAKETRKDDVIVDCIHNDNYLYACKHSAPYYPVETWGEFRFKFFIDGMVYNLNPTELKTNLLDLASSLGSASELRLKVKKFVHEVDGDFLISIYCPETRKFIIFNDSQARLSTYRMVQDDIVFFSRDIKLLLNFATHLEFDKNWIIENLALGYPLGTKTLFSNITRMSYGEAVLVDCSKESAFLEVFNTAPIEFNVDKSIKWNEKEVINLIKKKYLESVKNRINTVKTKGYRIIADLSGGFDTRAVLGGLSANGEKSSFHSIVLATGNETIVAKSIFDAIGSPGEFSTSASSHEYELTELDEVVYRNDGLVNYFTTIVCDNDIRLLKRLNPDKVVRFGGLGGEFIRHPFKQFIFSLNFGYFNDIYSSASSLKLACKISKLNYLAYKESARKYLSTYVEITDSDKLRRWYYEYYGNLVSAAAEDRERSLIWTVHPLWSSLLTREIFSKIPLERINYSFFCKFLGSINPLLLSVEVYNKDSFDISSEKSMNRWDCINEIMAKVTYGVKAFMPSALINFIKKINTYLFKNIKTMDRERLDILIHFEYSIKDNQLAYKMLDLHEARAFITTSSDLGMARNLITLIIYLRELNRRFGDRIVIEH
jgi:hypothetical protein